LIKGTFKDHLVAWVEEYLIATHGQTRANVILDDMDKRWAISILYYFKFPDHLFRIAAVPAFTGLRRFPQGRGFKQWTGDDSKALMKVCGHYY
jgi:hypothetical protein